MRNDFVEKLVAVEMWLLHGRMLGISWKGKKTNAEEMTAAGITKSLIKHKEKLNLINEP